MSASREMLKLQVQAFGERAAFPRFMLAYGKAYEFGPETFAGGRGEQGRCYMNACHLAFNDDSLTYVEGTIMCYGVPIDHAWCVNAAGIVIEPTLKPDGNVGDYFGVPFQTKYVRKAILRNGIYGLLDVWSARKTAPKLIELGLEAGQQWLLEKRKKSA